MNCSQQSKTYNECRWPYKVTGGRYLQEKKMNLQKKEWEKERNLQKINIQEKENLKK